MLLYFRSIRHRDDSRISHGNGINLVEAANAPGRDESTKPRQELIIVKSVMFPNWNGLDYIIVHATQCQHCITILVPHDGVKLSSAAFGFIAGLCLVEIHVCSKFIDLISEKALLGSCYPSSDYSCLIKSSGLRHSLCLVARLMLF